MRQMLARSGEIGHDLLAVDWASTPMGELEDWPQSLETVVRLMLSSRFAMWMCWGPELTFFCNEKYRRDTLGKKYPWALGRPSAEVWSEIWEDILPRVDAVTKDGLSTWDQSLMLFLERNGYPEETYHTFSYSPLYDESGAVAGLLCVVNEDTEQVVAQRRMHTLRDLGARRAAKLSEADTITAAAEELGDNLHDVPFSVVYLFDAEGATAQRACSTGFPLGEHPAVPLELELGSAEADRWAALDALAGLTVHLTDLADRFPGLPTGAWDQPPTEALVVPLTTRSQSRPYGFQVFGLNRHRPLDEGYRDFCDLVAGQLADSITNARAYDFERARAETLAELDQAKTDFFTNVSHEFRTPLTLLLGPAEDAVVDEAEPLSGNQRHRVEVILRNGQRLLKLVNTLLDFSRLESGRVEAQFEPVDLATYTRELSSMFDSAVERLGLSLDIDCEKLPGEVFVDRDLWAKVVLNLLSNAMKFTFEGGLTVSLRHTADGPVLEVVDTGTGISEAEVPHLFERFHRVSGARSRAHEGSGIGLALVAELVELHGGTVEVRSAPGQGSTFVVRLRYGRSHLPADQVTEPSGRVSETAAVLANTFLAESSHWSAPAGEPVPSPTATQGSERPRVLVVEDNPDIRGYVAGLLREDYLVQTAVDGVEGLAMAREHAPDLVLTDVMMPRMDGFELLAALQADPLTVGVPVVMLSARGGEEGTLEGLDAGADDYLVKPFTARELLARVRANLELDRARRTRRQLERSRSLLDQAQRIAQVGSWEIDLDSRRVRASDEFFRIVGHDRDEIAAMAYEDVVDLLIHPEDRERVQKILDNADETGFGYETRVVRPDGGTSLVAVFGELAVEGEETSLRGSVQDITERRAAEETLMAAAATAEAAAREHSIADQLQRSLLPRTSFDLDHLEVATFYKAGVEGTQVGGDWYDVIDLGNGRTALVVGDVMGRGVHAASVMGQLRSAVRAYARLDLPPADLLELLDGLVRELGDDQIVTCIYAVFDPADRVLRFANAGHLPPILVDPGIGVRLEGGHENPPLGAGPASLVQHEVDLSANTRVILYTDGLVERRGEDLDVGIRTLAEHAATLEGPVEGVPEQLVAEMLPDGPDDDVAILVARVDPPPASEMLSLRMDRNEATVADARSEVTTYLVDRGMPGGLVDDAVLVTSELVTNAMLYGVAPIDVRLRVEGVDVLVEVRDEADIKPRTTRARPEDEHGRGLQIVAALSARWGTRPTEQGKAVWCVLSARAA